MSNYRYSGGQPWGGYGNSQRAPYSPSYNRYGNSGKRSYQGAQQSPKKHSGASFKTMQDGAQVVSAWNYSRGKGMIKLYARPYKKTQVVESKNGKKWANLFCIITYLKTGQIVKTSCMLDVASKRLYVKELNMIATSRGKGGYFGKQF